MSQRMIKPTKWHVHPIKTQINLGICPIWSVFAVRTKKAWVLSYPLSAQRRLWSDWVDAKADLSPRWAHMPFCRFCHALAQIPLYKYLHCLPFCFCIFDRHPPILPSRLQHWTCPNSRLEKSCRNPGSKRVTKKNLSKHMESIALCQPIYYPK